MKIINDQQSYEAMFNVVFDLITAINSKRISEGIEAGESEERIMKDVRNNCQKIDYHLAKIRRASVKKVREPIKNVDIHEAVRKAKQLI